jgi:hypothetical protein
MDKQMYATSAISSAFGREEVFERWSRLEISRIRGSAGGLFSGRDLAEWMSLPFAIGSRPIAADYGPVLYSIYSGLCSDTLQYANLAEQSRTRDVT